MNRWAILFQTIFMLFLVFACSDEDDQIDSSLLALELFELSDHNYDSFSFNVIVNQNSTVYVGVVAQGSDALDHTSIKTTTHRVNAQIAKEVIASMNLDNLMLGQAYDVYAMAEDTNGNQTDVRKISASTLAVPGFTIEKGNEGPVSFTVRLLAQAETRFTYALQLASENALTAETISQVSGVDTFDLEINQDTTLLLTDLIPDTQYKLYYLLETREGVDLIFQTVNHTSLSAGFTIRKENASPNSFDVVMNSAYHANLKYVFQPASEAEVTAATISTHPNVVVSALAADTDRSFTFDNLTESTAYRLYYSLETLEGNHLLFGSLDHTTSAPVFSVASSFPEAGSSGFKVYDTIRVTFDRNVQLRYEGSMILRSLNGLHSDIPITLGDISVNGASIELNRNNYFRRTTNLPPLNMHFDQEYALLINGAIQEMGGSAIFNAEAIRFTTQAHPNYFHTNKADNNFTGPLNWQSISSYHLQQLTASKQLHNYSRASTENLTGDDVKVMIWDTGIYPGSEVFGAVVYQKIALDDTFIGDPGTSYYNHGTQMGRYALNFAPEINIYDVYKSAYPNGSNPVIASTPDLQVAIDEDVDIISLSGSGIGDDDLLAEQVINGGTVLATSLGNISGSLNDTTSYRHKEKFLPYYRNFTSSTGAFVCLQAIIDNGGGNYISLRSEAGHAKHYTLCLLETGQGATSQATATFSGIMALMLEANRENGNNYTPQQLVEILIDTAVDIGDVGVDNTYGHGYIDLDAAITKLKTGTAPSYQLYQNMDSGVSEFFQ